MRLLVATFDDEQGLLEATRASRTAGLSVHDAFTPYPVHGMDEAMGLKRSRLTYVCFGMGGLGLSLALWFQHWTSAVDWPINVGGKPMSSLPAFVPVAFELTILFAALGTVAALLLRTGLLPRPRPRMVFPGVSRDKHVLALKVGGASFDADGAAELLLRCGGREIKVVEGES